MGSEMCIRDSSSPVVCIAFGELTGSGVSAAYSSFFADLRSEGSTSGFGLQCELSAEGATICGCLAPLLLSVCFCEGWTGCRTPRSSCGSAAALLGV